LTSPPKNSFIFPIELFPVELMLDNGYRHGKTWGFCWCEREHPCSL